MAESSTSGYGGTDNLTMSMESTLKLDRLVKIDIRHGANVVAIRMKIDCALSLVVLEKF